MTTAVIILIAVFVALGALGLYVKNGIRKVFDDFEIEEPLDEMDILLMFRKNENNE